MPTVTVVGNVNDPEMKFTPAGKAVLEFSLAENHSKKDAQGQWQQDGTTWRKVTIWESKAEALADALKKGDRVIVIGNERLREWQAQDGTKGKTLELSAQWVGIIPKGQQQQNGQQYQQQGQPPQQGGFGGQPPQQQQQGGGWNQPAADPWGNPQGANPASSWGTPSDQPAF